MLERFKRKSENLYLTLKESDRRLTVLTSQLATADLKNRLLEDQVKILERDLKALNLGTSDNLNDAIEVTTEYYIVNPPIPIRGRFHLWFLVIN